MSLRICEFLEVNIMSKWLSIELSLLLLVSLVAFAGFVSWQNTGDELTGEAWYRPPPKPIYVPQPAQGLSLQQKQEMLDLLNKATLKSISVPNNPPDKYNFNCNEVCGGDKKKCINAFTLFADPLQIPFNSPQPIYTAMPLACNSNVNVFNWLKTTKWLYCTCV